MYRQNAVIYKDPTLRVEDINAKPWERMWIKLTKIQSIENVKYIDANMEERLNKPQ